MRKFVDEHNVELDNCCPGLIVDGHAMLPFVNDVVEVLREMGRNDMAELLQAAAVRAGLTSEVREFLFRWRLPLFDAVAAPATRDFEKLVRVVSHDVLEYAAVQQLGEIYKQVVAHMTA